MTISLEELNQMENRLREALRWYPDDPVLMDQERLLEELRSVNKEIQSLIQRDIEGKKSRK